MSVPYYNINSMTYSSSVLTINADFSNLRDGGSFSVVGFPSTIYFSKTFSGAYSNISTYSISLSASATYNLTFSFFKSPYINYPFDQPQGVGMTGGTLMNGGYPYSTGIYNPGNYSTLYQINRVVETFTFRT